MSDRESKLPRWAQDELALLRQRLAEAQKRIDELTAGGPEGTNTMADPYSDKPVRLKNDEHIRFRFDVDKFGDRVHIDARMQHSREGDYVELLGSDSLAVRPASSNVVQVWLVQR